MHKLLRYGFGFLFVWMTSLSQAQLIVPGEFLEHRFPMFNEDSIKARGIRYISIRMMRKPSLKPITDDGRRAKYSFDPKGRLISFQKTYPVRHGQMKTATTDYRYTGKFLSEETEYLGTYHRRTTYQKLESGDIEKSISVQRGSGGWQTVGTEVIHIDKTKNDSSIIVSKSHATEPYPPYMVTETESDLKGRKTRNETRASGRTQHVERWKYSGDLISVYSFLDVINDRALRIEYAEASTDNGKWCENNDCKDWSVVYYDDGLPKGWIFMNPETEDMEIWEFRYID